MSGRHWARIAWALGGLVVFVIAGSWGPPREDLWRLGVETGSDPRLGELVKAVGGWREALWARRRVVDLVCVVKDEAEFFEAIGTWDEGHWFPILVESEPELVLKFLRAFRPARVVRWSGGGGDLIEDRGGAAMSAVARAWVGGEVDGAGIGVGTAIVPMGPVAPGIVLSAPGASALAGGVALAAGRFQPLAFWDFEKGAGEVLNLAEALEACRRVELIVEQVRPGWGGLGDGCDFVTLAGDWPDRYVIPDGDKAGEASLDDLLGRSSRSLERNAYTGRLLGPAGRSVYQAMCGLFLRPESALLFNTYSTSAKPWKEYVMEGAAERLRSIVPVVELEEGREAGDRAGWEGVFAPVNRYGLILVNSSGGPSRFRLKGGEGRTEDVPWSEVPAAVVMIHSFSAARVEDEATIAGRWLANGAFLYFGSMNEPFLQAFRAPGLVGELLSGGVPLAAAVFKLPSEDDFGMPWRLRLVGDPMYYVGVELGERLKEFAGVDELVAVVEGFGAASSLEPLRMCLDDAYLEAARGRETREWRERLLEIDRSVLGGDDRGVYDALLAELVVRGDIDALRRAGRISEEERGTGLRRVMGR